MPHLNANAKCTVCGKMQVAGTFAHEVIDEKTGEVKVVCNACHTGSAAPAASPAPAASNDAALDAALQAITAKIDVHETYLDGLTKAHNTLAEIVKEEIGKLRSALREHIEEFKAHLAAPAAETPAPAPIAEAAPVANEKKTEAEAS